MDANSLISQFGVARKLNSFSPNQCDFETETNDRKRDRDSALERERKNDRERWKKHGPNELIKREIRLLNERNGCLGILFTISFIFILSVCLN